MVNTLACLPLIENLMNKMLEMPVVHGLLTAAIATPHTKNAAKAHALPRHTIVADYIINVNISLLYSILVDFLCFRIRFLMYFFELSLAAPCRRIAADVDYLVGKDFAFLLKTHTPRKSTRFQPKPKHLRVHLRV
jgi:hypothetical protein